MKDSIAILLAAGTGSRLLPITDKIPKPLVKVFGKPMIETNIEALQANGIKDIYIVVGYKKEIFSYLQDKYAGIHFVENPEYDIKNNISSVYALGDIVGSADCFISDADLVIEDNSIYASDFVKPGFVVKYIKEATQEWFFETDEALTVTGLKRGGEDGYNMADISFWPQADGIKLREIIKEEYLSGKSDNLLWEQVASKYFEELKPTVYNINRTAITEVDTVDDLAKLDPDWEKFN